jgi:hypothetical protein
VLDLVSQVRNVVLMNVYLGLGNSGGLGFWNEGYMSQWEVSLRATWVRGGRILSQQGGFQVSKRGTNGSKREQKKARSKGINLNSCNLYSCTSRMPVVIE